MNRAIALLILLLGTACGREAPRHFSVDDSFSEAEQETIRAAVAAWCDAAGWCPAETLWAENARFELVDHIEDASDDPGCRSESGCMVGGRNKGDGRILVARDRPRADDLGLLWSIVAHEAGHFCTEHTDSGLMSAYMAPDSGAMEIDSVAVDAWHAGCP